MNWLIETIVREQSDITAKGLLRELERLNGGGVIVDITGNDIIRFRAKNGRIITAQVSGLKDRLSQAKKKIRKAG